MPRKSAQAMDESIEESIDVHEDAIGKQ